MSQKTDLNKLEKKMYTSYFNDGILDMLLGYYLLWGGLFDMFASRIESDTVKIVIMLLGFGLIYPFFLLAKRNITIPRLGQVEFGTARRKKRTRLIVFTVAMVLATAALVILTGLSAQKAEADLLIPRGSPIGPVIIGLFVAMIIAGTAIFMDFDRMLIWAVFFGLSYMTGMLFDTSLPQMIGGGLIIVVGLVYLSSFLKRYPRVHSEEFDAS